jgi:antitoxin MazE
MPAARPAGMRLGFDAVLAQRTGCPVRTQEKRRPDLCAKLDGGCWIFQVYPTIRTESTMQVRVARWGNSLGLRIPKDIAQRVGLREGARVDVEVEGDRIVVFPARPRYVLAELLKGMTPQAMREAFDWGPDKGREIVDE